LAEQVKLPTGYYFTYGGQFENLQKATDRLLIAVPIALLLIFILLYFTFHSFKEAVLVYTAIPMSAIGGVFALLLRDMPFSISAGVGFIALFGVAVLNGIVLISTFNRLEKEGWNEIIPRIIEGAKTRLRPVLMTASVASLGFLPMALSTSAGAEVQKPLATVVIGGLMSATALTLFVLPLLYLVFMRNHKPTKNNKMKAITPILLLFTFLGFSQTSNAQNPVNVDRAIEIAMENNPQLRSKKLEIQSTQSLSKTAYELPKTDLNFQYGNTDGFEYNDGFQISQTIPFPTLFGVKKNLVKEQVKGQEWSKALTENELRKQVRTYYYQLAYLEHNASVLKYLDSIYADFAYQNLKNLMQTKEDFAIEPKSDYEPLLLTSFIDSSAIENHPSIQLLYQEAKIAEQNKKLERANSLPDFTFGYNNISLIGMHSRNGVEQFYGRGQRFSFVDVGITIPLFTTTRAKIRSLDYQKQSLELNAQWQQQQLKTELANALKQYEQNVSQFTYFKEQALPNADEIINAAKLGYSTGDISYVEYLFALQTTTDIQLNYLKSIQQINEAVTLIHSLISK